MDEKTENFWRILQMNLDWIKYSDAKATGILTIYGIIVTVVYSNAVNIFSAGDSHLLLLIISASFGISSLLAIYFAFRCITPRIVQSTEPSIIFFTTIRKNFPEKAEYISEAHSIMDSKVGLDEQLASQIHINALIAHQKFKNVTNSIQFFVVSILMLIAEIVLSIILGTV